MFRKMAPIQPEEYSNAKSPHEAYTARSDSMTRDDVFVPLDVPGNARDTYIDNYLAATRGTGRLMLFAGDQKVEHLNGDFFGDGIAADDNDPEHFFRIATGAKIGVFAGQLGLIARYGADYPDIPYLVKLNSKTNLVNTSQSDPYSAQWLDAEQVVEFRENSGLNIHAVGYTIYLGSEFEHEMLQQAAQIVYESHHHGLLTVLWIYPRGAAVTNETDPHLIAGACGVAACLGSDFVKVNYPKPSSGDPAEAFREAVQAAGRTRVVCAGGSAQDYRSFLQQLHDQIHISGASGNATGRNIHQRPLDEAVRFTNAIYHVTIDGYDVERAMRETGLE
jgi:fructose-bisphosphate aldolase / 6-deoxy-5-ketofructose 1-phosphate synthase